MKGAGRWLTVIGMVMAAFAGGAFMEWLMVGGGVAQAAAGKQAAAQEIRAQSFVLVDAKGREYARLGLAREMSGGREVDYPGLRFFDQKGARRLTIGAACNGSGAGMGLY